jgi:hypothetical protein
MFYLVANGINFLLMKKICAIMARARKIVLQVSNQLNSG